MTRLKEILILIGGKIKAFFIFFAANWKLILGGVISILVIVAGVLGFGKISDFFKKKEHEDDADRVIKENDAEIKKTKKWIKENKKLHETNEQAIDRYSKFLANNVTNS